MICTIDGSTLLRLIFTGEQHTVNAQSTLDGERQGVKPPLCAPFAKNVGGLMGHPLDRFGHRTHATHFEAKLNPPNDDEGCAQMSGAVSPAANGVDDDTL